MGFKIKDPFKKIGHAFEKIAKNPLQIVMYAGGAALMATGLGAGAGAALWAAAAGAGVGAASVGTFGSSAQDIATMGGSAQQRYLRKMTDAQNAAALEQSKAIQEQNRQSLLQQIRTARIARAASLTNYASEEGVVSSGALGALSSIGSQYEGSTTYAVRQARYQNAFQSYMNLYNRYQAKAQDSAIKWNNIKGALNMGLTFYGMGSKSTPASLEDEELGSFTGRYLSYGNE